MEILQLSNNVFCKFTAFMPLKLLKLKIAGLKLLGCIAFKNHHFSQSS